MPQDDANLPKPSIGFTIDDRVFRAFPGLAVYLLAAWNIPFQSLSQRASAVLGEARRSAAARFQNAPSLAAEEPILSWRRAYACAGVKPSKYRSSIESLIRRAIREDDMSVLPLVDLYNAASLECGAPLGAFDVNLLPQTEISLRMCEPEMDRFDPLGGTAESFALLPTIPVYAAGGEILCWCLNARDSRTTALVPTTTEAIFVSEGITETQRDASSRAIRRLADWLSPAGAKTELAIADSASPHVRIAGA